MADVTSSALGSVLNRGFERFLGPEGEHLCIRRHPNGLFVVSLAPSHPLLATGKVTQVTFPTELMENEAFGKRCRGGATVNPRSLLASVAMEDGGSFNIQCPIEARLVELNDLLLEEPRLLQESPEDEGFLAILQARRPQDQPRILAKLSESTTLAGSAETSRDLCAPRWAPEVVQ
eukprot:symbB.v1.2.009320.t1/scaffold585.1/size314277/10